MGSATLQWAASTDSRVDGYRVYWGVSPRVYQQSQGAGMRASSTTSHTISNLPAGKTYYFAVTAIDGSNESAFSAEASKTIP